MDRFIYSFIFILLNLTLCGQDASVIDDNSSVRYIVDNDCDITLKPTEEGAVWKLAAIKQSEVMDLSGHDALKNHIPFIGQVLLNRSRSIIKMDIEDPLIKYGSREVELQQAISLLEPHLDELVSGYSVALAPEELDPHYLNQLPIRPDSIKVVVSAVINDSGWNTSSIEYEAPYLANRSYRRRMDIERSVQIKIKPFGWTSLASVAPMIDWDSQNFVEQEIFIAKDIHLPYAILELRDNSKRLAVLDFSNSSEKTSKAVGTPQILAVPNPVINDVRFEISNIPEGTYQLKIKNILGEIKIQKTIDYINADAFPINIDGLRKGSYFYILEDGQGNILSTKRLIVLKP